MRRKPSASHCVQNVPDDRYRPSRAALAAGLMVAATVSRPAGGGSTKVSACPVNR